MTPEQTAKALDQAVSDLCKLVPDLSDLTLTAIYDDIRNSCPSDVRDAWEKISA